jgi:predicted RNase H-like nuclease (RuvC/YqgF family)
MTTIHTIEDLIRVLDENPQWAEALRARLLTRELLELPETVAALAATVAELSREFREFAKTTGDRLSSLEEGQQELRADVTELRADVTELRADVTELRADVNELKIGQQELRADVNELKIGQQELRTDVDDLKRGQARLQDDVGFIKGRFIYDIVRGDAGVIASEMGFALAHSLTRADLMNITRLQETTDIPRGDMQSFHRADLIMQVTDSENRPHYIAVEASFTVNGRDSRRALRNAELITRFTGQPAHPALAGVRSDQDIRQLFESGQLYWYEISSEDVQPE